MDFIVLLMMALICGAAFLQFAKAGNINMGLLDPVIKNLLSHYRVLREHHAQLGIRAFVFGYALEDHKGSLRENPEKLAVRILDEKGAKRDGAAELGMEVIEIEGRCYYQFAEPLSEKLSGAEMTAVLARIREQVEHRYPDDFVGTDRTYLTAVVEGKKYLAR